MNGYRVLEEFVDDESYTSVKLLAKPSGQTLFGNPPPDKLLIEVEGEYRPLDEFTHKCPCCGSETEVR